MNASAARSGSDTLTATADALRDAIARAHLELKAASAAERRLRDSIHAAHEPPPVVIECPEPDPEPAERREPPRSHAEYTQTFLTPRTLAKRAERRSFYAALATSIAIAITVMSLAYHHTRPTTPAVVVVPPAKPLAAASAPPSASTPELLAPSHAPSPPPPPVVTVAAAPVAAPRVTAPRPPAVPTARQKPVGPVGALTVVCLPARCDEIVDNGTALGPGHIFSRPVPAGRHVLMLRAPTGELRSLAVDVEADRTREVRVAFSGRASVDSGFKAPY